MSQGIRVHVWGERALFSRPEMKAERVSYDVITPSAARGVLEAIHWKPAIRWVIDRIHVLKPIRFDTIRRNEVGSKASYATARQGMAGGVAPALYAEEERQQRASVLLRNVGYVIDAHFEMTAKAGAADNPGKHAEMARRRIARGQCIWQPCLGCREFPAWFAPVDGVPEIAEELRGTRDLGWMLHDIEHDESSSINGRHRCTDQCLPHFFRATLVDGVIEVPPLHRAGGGR
ncbi:type I-C CRISPR-associated protein Cas5 [Azospirillum sp. INR13]|uniref:type I-C CRISPR-associated protein Cas5c n=1 Tax=Azospirillum sp. INR13 TaxID=2596919 RepID=UPI0018924896|nr:type I-C CRISPR-associated protein Cas5c [Azospirillum sp. INR13]MBF5095645.1 type I-C CRISPR-associated protein Cas5 [Azospirillum sp. INR13]